MRMFWSLVVIIVAAITPQAGFAADLTHASVPPDVLLQLEGHTLPPIADLASSGLIPGRYADAKSTVSEMGVHPAPRVTESGSMGSTDWKRMRSWRLLSRASAR